MNRPSTARTLATLGAVLAVTYVCINVWANAEFDRVYFPGTSWTSGLGARSVEVGYVAIVYFVTVAWTGHWASWRRRR